MINKDLADAILSDDINAYDLIQRMNMVLTTDARQRMRRLFGNSISLGTIECARLDVLVSELERMVKER